MCERSWVRDSAESQHLVSEVLTHMYHKPWWQRVVDIVDSMADGVGLPGLGNGWEVICDVLLMRIPGSQEKGEECSAVLVPSLSLDFWLSGRTLG